MKAKVLGGIFVAATLFSWAVVTAGAEEAHSRAGDSSAADETVLFEALGNPAALTDDQKTSTGSSVNVSESYEVSSRRIDDYLGEYEVGFPADEDTYDGSRSSARQGSVGPGMSF